MMAVRPILSRLRPRSLKAWLLGAFLLLSVIPLSAVGLFVYRQGEATLQHHQLDELATVAMLKSQQLAEWVKERQRDVIRPASIPFFQREVAALARRASTPEGQAAGRRLREILEGIRRVGEFNEMFLLDPVQGWVLLSTDPEQEGKVKNDRPYFREGLKGPHVQHVYYSLALGKAVMAFSAPVPAPEGRPAAILVGRVDLRYLDRLMAERTGLERTGRTFLVNRFNYFVSESLGRGAHGWRPVFSEGVRLALAGQTGTALYVNYEGRTVVGAYRWLPDLGLALIAEVDREEAFAPIKTLRIALTLAVAVVSGLAILVDLTLIRGITRPITQLVEAARAIGGGDLTRRVEVKHLDELATLASTVNRMADDLLRSRQEIEAYSQTLEARVEERTRELAGLLEVAQTVGSTLDLAQILRRVSREVARLLDADMVGAYLADAEGRTLRPVAGYRVPEGLRERFAAFPIPLAGHRFLEEAWGSRRPVSASDVATDPRLDRETVRQFPHRSLLFAPLVVQGAPIGGLFALWWERERRFAPAELHLVEGIASQAATAVANARLYEDLTQKNVHLQALFETARRATLSLNLADVLPSLVKSAAKLIGADASSLRLLDRSGTWLEAVTHHGLSETFAQRGPVKVGEGVSGRMVVDGLPLVVEDVEQDRRIHHQTETRAEGLRSLAMVPLRARDRILGTLTVYARTPRRYPPGEVDLLSQFANLAALAIENAQLYEELKHSYGELARAQDRLVQSEKLRALGEMAGGVAHDFNNLLTPILGRAQHLMLRLAEGEVAPEEVRRNLAIIERAAMDGAETVRRLLGFTRATPRPSEAEAVDAGELLASVVEASEPRWKDEAEARGARIEVVLDVRGVRPVLGNPAELREVLLNLVFNALDAMPEGGTLTLASWDEAGAVCLAVGDTGVGIPEEIRSRVFDPFFTTKGPQSSGLGLSVSYGIIRRHEGEIVMDSRLGQGTTFTIRLPVREASPPREPAPTPAPRRGLRVLAVDDEAEVREILREILEAAGHEVHEAGSGPEALEFLERQAVDLVCTDLGMPGMNGWEVADRIRARWPGVRVALVTGWGARVEPEELRAHGVDFLVAKPFQVEDLLHTLSKLGPVPGA